MTTIIVRDIQIIAAEINSIKEQVIRNALSGSIEIGKKLKEAKETVPHGEWGKWLEESVDYSTSTANNLMRVFDEYGNSQTLAHLNYTQAVALLAVPAEEREDFVEKTNAKDLSSRELQKAIKAKEVLEQQLKDSQAIFEKETKARQALADSVVELENKSKDHAEQVAKLNEELTQALAIGENSTAKKLKADLDKARNDKADSDKKVKELQEQLNKKPIDIPATVEVIPEATKKELETLRKAQGEHAEQLFQKEMEANKQVLAMQELLDKNNNTESITVKVSVSTLTDHFKALLLAINEMKNLEEKEKFKSNVKTLLDRLKETVV